MSKSRDGKDDKDAYPDGSQSQQKAHGYEQAENSLPCKVSSQQTLSKHAQKYPTLLHCHH